MPPIDPDTVLRAEANAIHPGRIYPDGSPVGHIPERYRELHRRGATALCLSGGGIRSASFALGIIEALAVHPRPATSAEQSDKQAEERIRLVSAPVPVSLHRIGRRLYRKLAVRVDRAGPATRMCGPS